ncbi:MAG TPA: helix-turn-helix domain-containing protein [Chitinophagaceae bacterium]|jgi:transcriptional regulator GlxA family with amidase domain|nr:helix-turn-helix domain-containing protein [Chitinophagaceae bacterium]
MRVAILNYDDVVPTSAAGPADILAALMRTYPLIAGKPLNVEFEIEFISESNGRYWKKPFYAKEQKILTKKDLYDLIIIPAMFSNKIETVLQKQGRLIAWIKQQYEQKAELASICVGAFLLAATGLLNGRKATTNWMFAGLFKKMYPQVLLEDDKIIIDQGRIYTCGGAFSFTSFMIYLIEKYCGHEEAIIASKILMINIHQQPQNSFSIFQFQHDHHDEAIEDVQAFIEKNYSNLITIQELASRCNMGVRNFMRRFQQATGNSPLEYLQRVRIEAAKKLLENKNFSIEQVAFKCGYEDMSFFRKVFKRHVSITPREYKEKYGKTSLKLKE